VKPSEEKGGRYCKFLRLHFSTSTPLSGALTACTAQTLIAQIALELMLPTCMCFEN
jgi:hypothetical protein